MKKHELAMLLLLIVVLVTLFIPGEMRCCYCEQSFGTEPLLVRLFTGKVCHSKCYWERHSRPEPSTPKAEQ